MRSISIVVAGRAGDPRARWRRMRGSHDTISRYPDMMFTAYCEKCQLNETVPTNDLMQTYGTGYAGQHHRDRDGRAPLDPAKMVQASQVHPPAERQAIRAITYGES